MAERYGRSDCSPYSHGAGNAPAAVVPQDSPSSEVRGKRSMVEAIPAIRSLLERCLRVVQPEGFRGDFMSYDMETTGLDAAVNVPWQISAVRFERFEPVESFNRVIRISREQFDSSFEGDEAKRARYGLEWERIESEGESSQQVYEALMDFTSKAPFTIGWNLYALDLQMTRVFCALHGSGRPMAIDIGRSLDMGAIIKAGQIGLHPHETDSLEKFFRRVLAQWARGVFWSMEKVVRTLQLPEGRFHDALADCLLTGMLVEFFHRGKLESAEAWQRRLREKPNPKTANVNQSC